MSRGQYRDYDRRSPPNRHRSERGGYLTARDNNRYYGQTYSSSPGHYNPPYRQNNDYGSPYRKDRSRSPIRYDRDYDAHQYRSRDQREFVRSSSPLPHNMPYSSPPYRRNKGYEDNCYSERSPSENSFNRREYRRSPSPSPHRRNNGREDYERSPSENSYNSPKRRNRNFEFDRPNERFKVDRNSISRESRRFSNFGEKGSTTTPLYKDEQLDHHSTNKMEQSRLTQIKKDPYVSLKRIEEEPQHSSKGHGKTQVDKESSCVNESFDKNRQSTNEQKEKVQDTVDKTGISDSGCDERSKEETHQISAAVKNADAVPKLPKAVDRHKDETERNKNKECSKEETRQISAAVKNADAVPKLPKAVDRHKDETERNKNKECSKEETRQISAAVKNADAVPKLPKAVDRHKDETERNKNKECSKEGTHQISAAVNNADAVPKLPKTVDRHKDETERNKNKERSKEGTRQISAAVKNADAVPKLPKAVDRHKDETERNKNKERISQRSITSTSKNSVTDGSTKNESGQISAEMKDANTEPTSPKTFNTQKDGAKHMATDKKSSPQMNSTSTKDTVAQGSRKKESGQVDTAMSAVKNNNSDPKSPKMKDVAKQSKTDMTRKEQQKMDKDIPICFEEKNKVDILDKTNKSGIPFTMFMKAMDSTNKKICEKGDGNNFDNIFQTMKKLGSKPSSKLDGNNIKISEKNNVQSVEKKNDLPGTFQDETDKVKCSDGDNINLGKTSQNTTADIGKDKLKKDHEKLGSYKKEKDQTDANGGQKNLKKSQKTNDVGVANNNGDVKHSVEYSKIESKQNQRGITTKHTSVQDTIPTTECHKTPTVNVPNAQKEKSEKGISSDKTTSSSCGKYIQIGSKQQQKGITKKHGSVQDTVPTTECNKTPNGPNAHEERSNKRITLNRTNPSDSKNEHTRKNSSNVKNGNSKDSGNQCEAKRKHLESSKKIGDAVKTTIENSVSSKRDKSDQNDSKSDSLKKSQKKSNVGDLENCSLDQGQIGSEQKRKESVAKQVPIQNKVPATLQHGALNVPSAHKEKREKGITISATSKKTSFSGAKTEHIRKDACSIMTDLMATSELSGTNKTNNSENEKKVGDQSDTKRNCNELLGLSTSSPCDTRKNEHGTNKYGLITSKLDGKCPAKETSDTTVPKMQTNHMHTKVTQDTSSNKKRKDDDASQNVSEKKIKLDKNLRDKKENEKSEILDIVPKKKEVVPLFKKNLPRISHFNNVAVNRSLSSPETSNMKSGEKNMKRHMQEDQHGYKRNSGVIDESKVEKSQNGNTRSVDGIVSALLNSAKLPISKLGHSTLPPPKKRSKKPIFKKSLSVPNESQTYLEKATEVPSLENKVDNVSDIDDDDIMPIEIGSPPPTPGLQLPSSTADHGPCYPAKASNYQTAVTENLNESGIGQKLAETKSLNTKASGISDEQLEKSPDEKAKYWYQKAKQNLKLPPEYSKNWKVKECQKEGTSEGTSKRTGVSEQGIDVSHDKVSNRKVKESHKEGTSEGTSKRTGVSEQGFEVSHDKVSNRKVKESHKEGTPGGTSKRTGVSEQGFEVSHDKTLNRKVKECRKESVSDRTSKIIGMSEQGFEVCHDKVLSNGLCERTYAHLQPKYLYPNGRCLQCQICSCMFTPLTFTVHHDTRSIVDMLDMEECQKKQYTPKEMMIFWNEEAGEIFEKFQDLFEAEKRTTVTATVTPEVSNENAEQELKETKLNGGKHEDVKKQETQQQQQQTSKQVHRKQHEEKHVKLQTSQHQQKQQKEMKQRQLKLQEETLKKQELLLQKEFQQQEQRLQQEAEEQWQQNEMLKQRQIKKKEEALKQQELLKQKQLEQEVEQQKQQNEMVKLKQLKQQNEALKQQQLQQLQQQEELTIKQEQYVQQEEQGELNRNQIEHPNEERVQSVVQEHGLEIRVAQTDMADSQDRRQSLTDLALQMAELPGVQGPVAQATPSLTDADILESTLCQLYGICSGDRGLNIYLLSRKLMLKGLDMIQSAQIKRMCEGRGGHTASGNTM